MAIFRVEKTRDYTVMSNHHLKNKTLSLKAKGLLSLILSLPDVWNYTLKGLSAISVEGIDAIRQAVTELEREGYMVRTRVRDEKGCLRGTEYVIYEHPWGQAVSSPGEPSTPNPMEEPSISKMSSPAAHASEAPMQDKPMPDSLTSVLPALENAALEEPTQLNTNRSNTYPINKTAAANPNLSNPYPPYLSEENGEEQVGWDRDGLAAADSFREAVKERIEYDVLAPDAHITRGRLNEIVDIMTEVLCATNPSMTIAGNDYPTVLVQERFRQITSKHIQYVFHCLNKNTSQVRNIKKYLLAVLFNAPATMDGYYAALINHDFGDINLDTWDC